jgi:hypothetical protein
MLFFGRSVSFLGNAMAPIALAFAVLDLTGSAGDLGIVLARAACPWSPCCCSAVCGVIGCRGTYSSSSSHWPPRSPRRSRRRC